MGFFRVFWRYWGRGGKEIIFIAVKQKFRKVRWSGSLGRALIHSELFTGFPVLIHPLIRGGDGHRSGGGCAVCGVVPQPPVEEKTTTAVLTAA